MTSHDLNNLRHRFLFLTNQHGGTEPALAEMFASLDPLNPKTAALRRALLADLQQDERGEWFYPNRDS